jgi:hypothetical protein
MKYRLSFLLLLLVLLYSVSLAEIRYVSKTGSSRPPYTTWESAADSIQKAINVSLPFDTIFVAPGNYKEKLTIDKFVYLIGLSRDSCIIDGSSEFSEEVIKFNAPGSTENFTIQGRGQNQLTDGIRVRDNTININNCIIKNANNGLVISRSSLSTVTNCLIIYCRVAIRASCLDASCRNYYSDNIIITKSGETYIIDLQWGSPVFVNNIVIEEGNTIRAIDCSSSGSVMIKNNLIAGYRDGIILYMYGSGYQYVLNNVLTNMSADYYTGAIFTGTGDKVIIQNNIIKDSPRGIIKVNSPMVRSDYNLFWNVDYPTNGIMGDGNIIADPMLVKDTIPNKRLDFDYHLQAYSPAIDAGNPEIFDVDGSRSDIGMYGGPDGKVYKYLDLAPKTPKNFTFSYNSTYNSLKLFWKKNSESDFRNYNIFRDSIAGFTPSEENLLAQTNTSVFTDYFMSSCSVYYRISAVDNQDNESQPGNEIAVIITISGSEPEFQVVRDYILYQNYPNPFNPSTTISYELKERAYVKLMVYDIKGELITVLVNKEQQAGYYETEFQAKDLPSGIYVYRIEVIGEGRIPVYSDMKKMVVLR